MLERKAWDEAVRDPSLSGLHEMDGRKMFLRNWAEEYGIKLDTLRNRIDHGWDLKRALTEKVQHSKRKY